MNFTYQEFKEQHDQLKSIIIALKQSGADKNIVRALVWHTNKFLYESMVKCMLEKDEKGNYINQEPAS